MSVLSSLCFGFAQLLLLFRDIVSKCAATQLSSRQTKAVEAAVAHIPKEMNNIKVQSSGNLPKFSGPAHEKAVLVDSWDCLIHVIKPLKHLPKHRRRVNALMRILETKNAVKALKKLPTFKDDLEELLMKRGQ